MQIFFSIRLLQTSWVCIYVSFVFFMLFLWEVPWDIFFFTGDFTWRTQRSPVFLTANYVVQLTFRLRYICFLLTCGKNECFWKHVSRLVTCSVELLYQPVAWETWIRILPCSPVVLLHVDLSVCCAAIGSNPAITVFPFWLHISLSILCNIFFM